METKSVGLMEIFSGWDGYQTSLVRALAPLTEEQLAFRLSPDLHSVGEIAVHLAFGRIDWFSRMGAPGAKELSEEAAALTGNDPDARRKIEASAPEIVEWLEKSWRMVESNLSAWTVADLSRSYHQHYAGNVYEVSYQWVIWRIMAHDIHHGGQLSMLLYKQGIEIPDLGDNGGHIIEPPVVCKEVN